ncbi:MAG: hypothetical protein ABW215_00690, partial [Kibdelosporangium sp.]
GEASVLIGLSAAHRATGEPATAIMHAKHALHVMHETDMRVLEASALTELAAGLLEAGELGEARAQVQEALRIARAGGQRLVEARARYVLGDIQRASQGHSAAVEDWQAALAVFTELKAPEADEIRRLMR